MSEQQASVADEQEQRELQLIARVAASFDATPDPRLRELLQALTRHLHAFLREVRLSEEEWRRAVEFLTATGHITDDKRQEFVLLSDVLGASMQVVTMADAAYAGATEATVLGPFFVEGSPAVELGGDIGGGAAGEPCWVEGTVTDTAGRAVPHARLEVWETDENGFYDVQYGDERVAARGHLVADEQGRYRFWAVTPTPYPIPDNGPVGALLAAAGRSPMRAAHLHFRVEAPGLRTLVTHVFVRGDELLDRDSVFGVRESLVLDVERHPATAATPDGRELAAGTWTSVRFDMVLAPADGAGRP
jgi:hydroxyquinol 1,2-dioxygenase